MVVKTGLAAAVIVLVISIGAHAQVNGVPPSVTSLGPGRSFAPPASVTSLGPHGFSHAPVLLGGPVFFQPGLNRPGVNRGAHRGFRPGFGREHGGVVFVPYAVPVGPMYGGYYGYDGYNGYDNVGAEPDQVPPQAEAPTPTVIERRPTVVYLMPGGEAQTQPAMPKPEQQAEAARPTAKTVASESAAEPEPRTVLVFKDGHKQEITNYAIQGDTLYNLSGNGPRKIALADLNLGETQKLNEDRGISFRLP